MYHFKFQNKEMHMDAFGLSNDGNLIAVIPLLMSFLQEFLVFNQQIYLVTFWKADQI